MYIGYSRMLLGITTDLLESLGVAWRHGGFIGVSWCCLASRRIYWSLLVLHGVTADLLESLGVAWRHGGFIGVSWCCLASRRIYWSLLVLLGITADLLELRYSMTASRRIYWNRGIAWWHHGGFIGVTAIVLHHGGYNL